MGHFLAAVAVTLFPIPEGVTVTADHCSKLSMMGEKSRVQVPSGFFRVALSDLIC